MGIRRIAQALHTTPKTVQKKIKFLAILCEKFHLQHFGNWKVKPRFQFDEMWSVERNRFDTLTIPMVVEKESYFIVCARSAHTNSLSGHPSIKNFSDYKRWGKISVRDLMILKALDRVNVMKPNGRIIIDTDKKIPYMNFLKQVFGSRLVHKRYNASIPLEAKKLFPINNTMACMRAEIGKVKREGWYLTKDNTWLNAHLAIYTVYYNYFRVKKCTKAQWKMPPVPVVGVSKIKREWEHKTPAMKLGIFDEPISFKFLLENYESKAIPATTNNVVPITRQLPGKKAA